MTKLPRIYCDMDGVLCDFKKAAHKTTGVSISKWMTLSKSDKWGPIFKNKRFWEDMPWQSGGQALWSFISKYKPHILSAYVEESYDPNCIPGKTKWARSHLGLNTQYINLVRRSQKQNFAKMGGGPAVLIDDYRKNTDQFTSRGGVGILHTSTSNTIRQLKKLGF